MSERVSRRALIAHAMGTTGLCATAEAFGSLAPTAQGEEEWAAARRVETAVAGARGIQAVLLPFWSTASVDRFLNVFKDRRGRYTLGPPKLAIGFLPYQFGPTFNYVNARRIVNTLAPARILSVTVHLSFHWPREATREVIRRNAADFAANFAAEYAQRANVTISVCPSLEDYASNDQFSEVARIVASEIPGEHIGRIRLRRNPIGAEQEILGGAEMGYAGREVELHGGINLRRHAYSNDGNLVYDGSENEDAGSVAGPNPAPQYEVLAFRQGTAGSSKEVLLWRPAYNLFRKARQRNGKVLWTKEGRDLRAGDGAFTESEQRVLRRFLGI